MKPTPNTDLIREPKFFSCYEPAGKVKARTRGQKFANVEMDFTEDTYILLDALEQDAELLQGSTLCLEIGSGSGCVSTFLTGLLPPNSSAFLTTDLNPACSLLTSLVATQNNTHLEPLTTDLVNSLLPRIKNQVDILIFNPPYVETDENEVILAQSGTDGMMEGKGIDKSWAGGVGGMEVTNRLLELVDDLLSPRGLFYLVAIPANDPEGIIAQLTKDGLIGEIILKRRAGREHLQVLRFSRSTRNET